MAPSLATILAVAASSSSSSSDSEDKLKSVIYASILGGLTLITAVIAIAICVGDTVKKRREARANRSTADLETAKGLLPRRMRAKISQVLSRLFSRRRGPDVTVVVAPADYGYTARAAYDLRRTESQIAQPSATPRIDVRDVEAELIATVDIPPYDLCDGTDWPPSYEPVYLGLAEPLPAYVRSQYDG